MLAPPRRRQLRPVEAPFRPEGGAYGHGRTHGHHHGGADRRSRPRPRGLTTGARTRGRARCRSSPPGSRRATRSAPTATRTASSGRSRPATSPTAPASPPGSPTCSRFGAGRTDAMLLAAAWRADDPAPLAELAEALAPSAERAPRDDGAGRGLRPHHRGGLGDRRAGDAPTRSPSATPPGASACRSPTDGDALPAGLRRQPRLGRRAARPARPDRRPAHHSPASCRSPPRVAAAALAAPPRRGRRHRPARRTSRPCGTRPSTAGSTAPERRPGRVIRASTSEPSTKRW